MRVGCRQIAVMGCHGQHDWDTPEQDAAEEIYATRAAEQRLPGRDASQTLGRAWCARAAYWSLSIALDLG